MFTSSVLGGLLPWAVIPLAALCLVVSAIGFRKTVYFISIGYGYSIAAMAIASLVLAGAVAGPVTWLAAILLAIYGIRLGTYLVIREGKASYQATQKADGDRSAGAGLAAKLGIWVTVALLYPAMFMPALARFAGEARGGVDQVPALSIAGVAVMAAGIAIEAIADRQKSAAKKKAPGRFCDSGLYRIMRCPNYFGELLVWTGNLLAGAAFLGSWLAWVIAGVGYLAIFLIMKGSARRLEIKQGERYGSDPDYRRYAETTPILFPFLPIYSFRESVIYLG
jgi:steroid 5-alpha reductase family enzyme